MSGILTEATLITLIGGFISIITILIKYRLDNNKSIKAIKELAEGIKAHDVEQDKKVLELNNKLDFLNGSFEKFTTSSQLETRILYKYFAMQFELNNVLINDVKNNKHNGDLIKAEQKIENFRQIVENEKFKDLIK